MITFTIQIDDNGAEVLFKVDAAGVGNDSEIATGCLFAEAINKFMDEHLRTIKPPQPKISKPFGNG